MRSALVLSSLASLFVTACSVGEVPTNNMTPDSGGDSNTSGCVNRIAPAAPAHTHDDGGGTNARKSCIAANCHGQPLGVGAPQWQFAGSVVKPGGVAANTGVTVRVTSAAGMSAETVTDAAGNFSIPAGTLPNPFPATVIVTACPTSTSMVSMLVQGQNDCSAAGTCHGGAQGPVNLP
jgi:hypothetical protein